MLTMNSSSRSHLGVQMQIISPAELYGVIVGASSQDVSCIQASSQRLKQMLDMFGAYDALQEIAARHEVPLPVRQQAIIQFKNVVVHHWRSRKLLSDEHRTHIRQRCLSFVDEDDETIADCNEVVVAKLARTDYPNLWPTLINDLIQIIDANLQKRYVTMQQEPRDTLRLRRSLKLLNGVLKEFASIKLPTGMKAMAQIVGQIRHLLYGYYSRMAVTFSANSITPENIASDSIYDNILLSHLVYKCLIKIAIWLWNKIERLSPEEYEENIKWVQELFQNSMAQLKSLGELRKSIVLSVLQNNATANDPTRRTISILTRHLRVFGKFFRRIQQLSLERFISLPMSSDLIMFYWSQIVDSTNYPQNAISDSDEALFPVRFLVQGMVLFKESISHWTPIRRSGMPNKHTLSEDFVQNAVQLLVTRFMPLNTSDLESWIADPEEWMNLEDKENDQWEYEIRACSERVLMHLCNQFPDFVVPFLKGKFEETALQPSAVLEGVVLKEALYCAVGRCAIRLKDAIDFTHWLEHTLSVEARDPNPNYAIIKRRIAWLVGKLVSEACVLPENPMVWKILVHLLQKGTDTVVRLTAAAALRDCVDVVGFDPRTLGPFLDATIPQLMELMSEADTLESKRKVDGSLNTIIEQSGALILPFVAIITAPIPQLWVTADTDLLFKASLLVTITKVVEAVKEHSSSLSGLVVPLIRESLQPKDIVQLDADGLSLWLTALRNTNSINSVDGSPSLRDLFPKAMELLATNLDLLGSITEILESYLLLDVIPILETCAVDLFRAYFITFTNKNLVEVNAKQLLQSLELLVQLAPSELWGEAMHTSGLFPHLLKTLIAGEIDTLVLTEHVYLFSRMLLSNRHMFLQLIAASAPVLNQSEAVLYNTLLDQWWARFDNMSEPRHRKLTALGIAALVSTGRSDVLQRLHGDIFNLWLDVFGELKEAEEQAAARDETDSELASPTSLVRFWELDKPPNSYYHGTDGTPEYIRRQSVYEKDVVRTTPLVAFIGAQLREAELTCGSVTFQSHMSVTDPTVLKQIQDVLARG